MSAGGKVMVDDGLAGLAIPPPKKAKALQECHLPGLGVNLRPCVAVNAYSWPRACQGAPYLAPALQRLSAVSAR